MVTPPRCRFPTVLAAFLTLLFFQCDTAPASAPNPAAPEELGPVASVIRNPVDNDLNRPDTVNVAKISFPESTYRFGTVSPGKIVKHTFEFTNTGRAPLLITDARSTCGCAVPSYPEHAIAPGQSGVIEVAFDTKNKSGYQEKPISIFANTYPSTTTIYLSGRVEKK